MDTLDDELAARMNANTADLEEFKSRGGKLILAHGFADPRLPTLNTIAYYERLITSQTREGRHGEGEREGALRRTQEFARLFLFPGVSHCGGGAGADTVEGDPILNGPSHLTIPRLALDPLVQWVEHGVPPDRVTAYKVTSAGVTLFSRPVCPYPELPRYKGWTIRQKPAASCAPLTATATTTNCRPQNTSTMGIITLSSRSTTATAVTNTTMTTVDGAIHEIAPQVRVLARR